MQHSAASRRVSRTCPSTLVVENAIASDPSGGDPVHPICRNKSSKQGGSISAIGTDPRTLRGPSMFLPPQWLDDGDGGTSMAAPQVAGIAAMMWAVRPQLTPQQIAARLVQTARPIEATTGVVRRCGSGQSAPVADAYAAVLSTDRPNSAPALLSVLDVQPNSRFDEQDIDAFLAEFDAAKGAVDYGRYDLNGDGRTGGDTSDRLDLDRSDPVQVSSTTQTVGGLPLSYDETALTDLDILCHAANDTVLYRGDSGVRQRLNAEHCFPKIGLYVSFPSSAKEGEDLPLHVLSIRSDLGITQPGVHLDLSATGGTVTPTSGVTDPEFDAVARLDHGADQITVLVKAVAGGRVLAAETVTATAPPLGPAVRWLYYSALLQAHALACAQSVPCAGVSDLRIPTPLIRFPSPRRPKSARARQILAPTAEASPARRRGAWTRR